MVDDALKSCRVCGTPYSDISQAQACETIHRNKPLSSPGGGSPGCLMIAPSVFMMVVMMVAMTWKVMCRVCR